MLNKLRTRLILWILVGTFLSITLVSILTNINVLRKFELYMENEQDDRFQSVVQLVQNAYTTNQGWTREVFNTIAASPLIDSFDIEIKDNNDTIIFSSYMESEVIDYHHNMMNRMGRSMMGGRGHGMMMRRNTRTIEDYANDENYIIENQELIYNEEKIGELVIGYIGPYQISEKDITFSRDINSAILYAAIISIIAAIILGMYSSGTFLKPILKITRAANHIREGKLDTKVEIDNNIIELQELAQSINHLSKSLKEQELLRSRLTSDIAHELRTPLTVLQSHIEAISDGIWEATPEKLNICKNEVIRLIKLVEELKYLNDIENHNLELKIEKYSLSKDIKEISASFQHQFVEKNIEFKLYVEDDINIYADRDRIRQVIINLLSNAFKFTSPGGRVNIQLYEEDMTIKCIITDTGIGIDTKDIPYVFERLYRSDISRNRDTGGIGIGLSITKTIIEAHGGTIEVKSKENEGSIFTFTLPRR